MLDTYERKRNFNRTVEPRPKRSKPGKGALRFTIQKHAARNLHYDFRLELDGALKSWAVPKGPSLDPADKRLAVMVEDHPLEYASFEGSIPQGEYGAGEVIVWDKGHYSPLFDGSPILDRKASEEHIREALSNGKLSFVLKGKRLQGAWALVRLSGQDNNWLLIKENDDFVNLAPEIVWDDHSVISNRVLRSRKRSSARDETRHAARPLLKQKSAKVPVEFPGAVRSPMPKVPIPPMPATLTDRAFTDPLWIYEPKLDGMRILARIEGHKARLFSRTGREIGPLFPVLVRELSKIRDDVLLDGEVVAAGPNNAPSFQRLQRRINLTRSHDIERSETDVAVSLYVFDLLYYAGLDLRKVPLRDRRTLLDRVIEPRGPLGIVAQLGSNGDDAYTAAIRSGFEGVIAKRLDSKYESGRSRRWLKIKAVLSDDFIIGGFTRGTGWREKTFGSLLLGQYDEKGELVFSGHVGTGFNARSLSTVWKLLHSREVDVCPFARKPSVNASTTWVRPELIAEVKYMERTHDGILRAPVFLRIRSDKAPAEVEPAITLPSDAALKSNESADELMQSQIESVLNQLTEPSNDMRLEIGDDSLRVSHLDKTLWPTFGERRGLTKRDLLTFLAKSSPFSLTHLKDRPITFIRYPDGVGGKSFIQRHWATSLPPFVETVKAYSEQNDEDRELILCNNLATLLWFGQLATLEFNTWFSRINAEPDGGQLSTTFTGSATNIEESLLNYPDFLVFDLDPYIYSGKEHKGAEPELNREAFAITCETALQLKEILVQLGLSPFVKTSGKTGLHVYAPVIRNHPFDVIRSVCETIGRHLMATRPDKLTMEWTTAKRRGKIFFDHNMNARSKTIIAAYSPRADAQASVSLPLEWKEVGKVYPTEFSILNVPERLMKRGDPWAGILDAKRDLEVTLLPRAV